MTAADLSALTTQVLIAAALIGVAFGALAQRTHFCTMGAFSDLFSMGDSTRLRMWAAAAGVAMLGFGALCGLGFIDPSKTLYAAPRVLVVSALLGGAMFGFGMVLASGCGSKTLVRIGGGSLKSLVVFVVLAIAAFATLKGITAVVRASVFDPLSVATAAHSLPAALSGAFGSLKMATAVLCGVVGLAMLGWAYSAKSMRSADGWLGGAGIGLTVAALWWVSGKLGFIAEHPDTLQEAFLGTNSGRAESLTFVAPIAYTVDWLMFFSDKSKVITVGIASALGVIAGAAVVALATRTFRWEGFRDAEDTANHLVGAVLMGVGGVMAMGCTVGQGLSGLSTLSFTSMLAVLGIAGGAFAALKYQMKRLEAQL